MARSGIGHSGNSNQRLTVKQALDNFADVTNVATADAAPVLAVEQVGKVFTGLQALTDVDLELRGGEVLGIIGPNGAGKSTLINVITGLYPASSGSVRFA